MNTQHPLDHFTMRKSATETSITVFLSPHRDDVAFSMSALAEHPVAKLAVNLFTRSSYTAHEKSTLRPSFDRVSRVSATRALEDRRYFDLIGLEAIDFDGEEPSLRGRKSRDPAGTGDDVSQIRDRLVAMLTDLARHHGHVCLIAPAAIGGHVNHLAARQVAFDWVLADPANRNIGFFEDIPYAANWWTRRAGIASLKRFVGSRPLRRRTFEVSKRKLDYINIYASQHRAPVTHLSAYSPATLMPSRPHEAIWEIA